MVAGIISISLDMLPVIDQEFVVYWFFRDNRAGCTFPNSGTTNISLRSAFLTFQHDVIWINVNYILLILLVDSQFRDNRVQAHTLKGIIWDYWRYVV